MIKKKIYLILILIYHLYDNNKKKVRTFNDFLNLSDQNNSILIASYETFHLECLPGFINYFINLKYKVDILIQFNLIESIGKLKSNEYIRIFPYKDMNEIKSNIKILKNIIMKYKFLLLLTLEKYRIQFYKDLGYYNHSNSLFIIHHIDELYSIGLKRYILENKVFGLIDTGKILYLNPSYFGDFKISFEKHKITKFFITSTKNRNYTYFLKGIYLLKKKSIDFKINIIGRSGKFKNKDIPKELRIYFHFYSNIPYQKMYKIIQESDFIILNLFPSRKEDNIYKYYRATGNAQISYGFCKPVLVEKSFSSIYKFSDKNSIIYNNNDLDLAMMKAAKITNKKYKILVKNLGVLRKKIYRISFNNLKKILNKYK